MKSVDTGKEKVKKICEVLRKETLDPAKKEGEQIIAKARAQSEKIIADAKKDGERIHEEAKKKIEEERNVFRASMNLACKKSIETLKEKIDKELFNPELSHFVHELTKDPKVASQLISAIVSGLQKEGVEGDLRAIVSNTIDVEAVNKELVKGILERLKKQSIEVEEIEGGAKVKIENENLTIDLSSDALKNLLSGFLRDDFRSILFASS